MTLEPRRLGGARSPPIGLGCMNLSHAYGHPPAPADARALLLRALDLGVMHFDTAALYGFGANEALLGEVLAPHRRRICLASKCGMTGINGRRVIDGRPETLKRTCDEALRRLQTDFIDLYYLHRWDRQIPIEDSVGALHELVLAGKIGAVGLCEVSALTLRRASRVYPIAALQSEYSLCTRNPEVAVFEACAELGTAFVAFSPLGRGFLAGSVPAIDSLAPNDIRRGMPRFQEPNFSRNRALMARFRELAGAANCTPAQLALAWLLRKSPYTHVIPGTTCIAHLEENSGAGDVVIEASLWVEAERLLKAGTVSGARYPADTQAEIDTEEIE